MDLPASLTFLDFEASSLSNGSYPIEVGWTHLFTDDLSTETRSCLIRPEPTWTDWSAESERVHGISRAELNRQGLPAHEVRTMLAAELAGVAVHVDSDFDIAWMWRLFEADRTMILPMQLYRLWRLRPLFSADALGPVERAMLRLPTPPHRAGPDSLRAAAIVGAILRADRHGDYSLQSALDWLLARISSGLAS
jgi:hypothetical protein